MPTSTPQSRLADDLLRVELARLKMERATGSHRVYLEPEQRRLRICRLTDLIRRSDRGQETAQAATESSEG